MPRYAEPVAPLTDTIRRTPEFFADAKCRDMPTEFFYPDPKDQHAFDAKAREARKFCEDCPVIDECLNYAIENGLVWGVWGGTSERERRRMVKRYRRGLREAG